VKSIPLVLAAHQAASCVVFGITIAVAAAVVAVEQAAIGNVVLPR